VIDFKPLSRMLLEL